MRGVTTSPAALNTLSDFELDAGIAISYMFKVRGIGISDRIGCNIRQTLSIGSELEL